MLILLIRHAQREYRTDRQEHEQVLTPKGEQDAAVLARNIKRKLQEEDLSLSAILTSTYRRASQTAEIIAPALGLAPAAITALDELQAEPDGSVDDSYEKLKAIIRQRPGQGLAIVGHGPDLARLCQRLAGLPVQLKKAQALALEWDPAGERGRILWQAGHKPA